MKYNKSKIMTNAWYYFKQGWYKGSFSNCLKAAWKKAKAKKNQVVPAWFVNKNLDQHQAYAVKAACPYDFSVDTETEKAFKFYVSTDFGTISFWAPKSISNVELINA